MTITYNEWWRVFSPTLLRGFGGLIAQVYLSLPVHHSVGIERSIARITAILCFVLMLIDRISWKRRLSALSSWYFKAQFIRYFSFAATHFRMCYMEIMRSRGADFNSALQSTSLVSLDPKGLALRRKQALVISMCIAFPNKSTTTMLASFHLRPESGVSCSSNLSSRHSLWPLDIWDGDVVPFVPLIPIRDSRGQKLLIMKGDNEAPTIWRCKLNLNLMWSLKSFVPNWGIRNPVNIDA